MNYKVRNIVLYNNRDVYVSKIDKNLSLEIIVSYLEKFFTWTNLDFT